MSINVIGAGLAGCEAAWRIAESGVEVNLFEMKPSKFTPAHKSANFAELVCSNSLKAKRTFSAAGLLKAEMSILGSLLLQCAKECRVPAGGALAVDRGKFSAMVTAKIRAHPLIKVGEKEVMTLPQDEVTIVATGPLTSEGLSKTIVDMCGGALSFFDAAAPIITAESIDMDHAFFASRYDKGDDAAYINCPLNKAEYEAFYNELITAQRAEIHDVDVQDPKVYEGCMPVEVMAQRGEDTLRFGPMKPVGLRDPKTGHRPWAVLQLRMENAEGTLYNMVGFQTNLKFGEQRRVFSFIPALKNAEFMRYGVMHRNTFINSPKVLSSDFSLKDNPKIFFAGQITGVEGYMESAATGIIAGINAVNRLKDRPSVTLPCETMIGALSRYVSVGGQNEFQPMGANFGILPALETHVKDKKARYEAFANRSIKILKESCGSYENNS